jgi:hypothetical protein
MPTIAPPVPPVRVALADDDRQRFTFRHSLLLWTLVTIIVTGWLVSLGPVTAILGLAVAKHILVAILVMALGVDQPKQAEVP